MTKVEILKDEVAEKLDELADLSEYWKKHREEGITPNAMRVGMLTSIKEIMFLLEINHKNY